jgi:PAS domain S-box-containing protein
MPIRPTRKLLPYLAALLAVAAATIASAPVAKNLGILLAIYFTAVIFAGLYGGFGPALLATVSSYIAVNWFYVDPRTAFGFNSTAFVFFFVCLAIAVFSEVSRRAVGRATANAEQIKLLVESITDGYVVVDSAWHLTYMNRAAEEIERRYRGRRLGPGPIDLYPVTLGSAGRAKLEQAAEDRRTVEFEDYYEPWQRWFEIKASPTEADGLAIYFRDITERKRAEEELRRLASIIESSEDAVIGMDLEGTIASWNAAAVRLYGYSAEEVLDRSVAILVPHDLAGEEPEILAKIRQGVAIRHYDTVRLTKDGRRVDVSITVSPIKGADGQIVGCSKIVRDIADRKRAEEALREADRRKDDFLALLGHELRNPLAGIMNSAQVLNQFRAIDPEARQMQSIIERQAAHMSRLIDDLLDVSRIVRGKIALQWERVDLAALARQSIGDHRASVDERGIALDVDVSQDPLWVDGDTVRLSQVLDNLLNNAIKFTDRGGRIGVRAACDPATNQATVEVQDSGIGMTAQTLDSLFEPFAQAEGTVGRSSGGLGLGLAIVKGLVELHRGAIQAHSPGPRLGATFSMRLPLCPAPATLATNPAADDTSDDKLRVLIIDDNRDAAVPMSKLLSMRGHMVTVAMDGPEGIAKAREFDPDVILCDIGLPQMSGYDVAQALRADSTTKNAFLVAVTGFGQNEDRRRAAEAGFDRHMTKPVSYLDLLGIMKQVGSSRQPSIQ